MEQVVISLGSNEGDRLEVLRRAVAAFRAHPDFSDVRSSSVYETEPVGYTEQPPFLNLVIALRTQMPPPELLAFCQQLEAAHGRVRTVRWGPRTLDVDIVSYGDLTLDLPELTLPHPRAHERAFVLVPMLELDADARLGPTPARHLLERIGDKQGIRVFAPPL